MSEGSFGNQLNLHERRGRQVGCQDALARTVGTKGQACGQDNRAETGEENHGDGTEGIQVC